MTPWLNVIRIDNVEYDVTEFIPNHPETFLKKSIYKKCQLNTVFCELTV